MLAETFSKTDRKVLGLLSILLVAGVAFGIYRQSHRPLTPSLVLSAMELPSLDPSRKASQQNQNLRPVPLDLNRAVQEELERLPGVGPVLAQRILQYRQKKGGFKSVQELSRVPGIGPKKLAQIQTRIFVAAPGTGENPPKTVSEASSGKPQEEAALAEGAGQ